LIKIKKNERQPTELAAVHYNLETESNSAANKVGCFLWVPLWFPRFKRTTPTLLEFGGNTLNSYNTEREAFWKDVLMPEKKE
jgi:hypothetical protein